MADAIHLFLVAYETASGTGYRLFQTESNATRFAVSLGKRKWAIRLLKVED